MKIGFDIRPLMDANYSGVSEFTKEVLSGLLSLDSEDEFKLYYNSFKSVTDRFPVWNQENVEVVATHYPNKLFNYVLQKYLHRPKLDLLADADVFFAPHLNFYALSPNRPSILVVHDLSFLRYPQFFSWRKNVWHRQLRVKRLVNQFSKVVAISNNTKQDLIELCGLPSDKIEVIYSGIAEIYRPIDLASPEISEMKIKYGISPRFILSLGTIEPRKNLDGLIAAYELLLDSNKNLNDLDLVIVGGMGWKSEAINRAWKKSKYHHKIKFIGYVDNADKPFLYGMAELFVFPSFYEGFGFPPLEAMACGTPVVSSFASSLPEILGDAAIYVDPFNVADIAKGMAEALSSDEVLNELKAKGLAQAEKYSWTIASAEYLKLIKKISNEKTRTLSSIA